MQLYEGAIAYLPDAPGAPTILVHTKLVLAESIDVATEMIEDMIPPSHASPPQSKFVMVYVRPFNEAITREYH